MSLENFLLAIEAIMRGLPKVCISLFGSVVILLYVIVLLYIWDRQPVIGWALTLASGILGLLLYAFILGLTPN